MPLLRSRLIYLRHGFRLAALLRGKNGGPLLDELGVCAHRDGAVLNTLHHAVPVDDKRDAFCAGALSLSALIDNAGLPVKTRLTGCDS